MKLLVGLGNPGVKYQDNRHNIGFKAIEAIANRYGNPNFQDKFDGQVAKIRIENKQKTMPFNGQVILFMPMTYMNNSGIPLSKVVNFYKILINDIYVIHDDLDLEVGRIKIKQGGGNSGHNGLFSIDSYVGKMYNKVRVGIGRPEIKAMVSNYVLSDFTNHESEEMQVVLNFIADKLPELLNGEFVNLMNLFALHMHKL
ncbi:aminoacyl-tRNA hydrolase [Candidatus Bandiella euplotis]|uniref:Peptidyl-tRNA hydrolase n=1 Tax=Candidatus Bandiella euplotis TaxID=1664265 RepID=A0ABZ0UKL5_9RICK|nr:aminoacyl-tRNA hydrolase [Candidatus Bandiella woodruffii]WPX96670.1 Aminoacyl-tRNA hydrolase [Candidatus Bandiella woodruffii]